MTNCIKALQVLLQNYYYQWRLQSLSDATIPVWVPKLGAQIKGEVMQNKIGHLIIFSMQMSLHILRHLISVKYTIMLN